MKRFQHDLSLRIVKLLNIVLATVPFALCWFAYYGEEIVSPYYYNGNLVVIGLFALLYFLFARVYDAMLVSINRISEMIYSQALAVMLTDAIAYIVICLMGKRLINILPGVAALAGQLVLLTIWSLCAHIWYYKTFPPKKTALIYDRRYGIEKLIHEYGLTKKFDIRLTIHASRCASRLEELKDMETVFISGVGSHIRNTVMKYCIEHDIQVYVLPRIGDIIMSGAQPIHMFHLPMLRVDRKELHPEQGFLKRLMDILLCAIALLVLSPVMIITAIAIKATDGGPVFYKQNRLTKDGKVFQVLKFRSMRVDAEKDGVARLSTGDKDDRITPVGHIIRKLRIDELPQLLNILGGSMSIVGPRPERPEIAQQYEEVLPEFRLRLQVKAGLTGYAQVYGKYNTTPYDKLQMDLMYIANPSIVEDLKIILATIKIIFLPESTDGIAENQTTAMQTSTENEEDLVGAEK